MRKVTMVVAVLITSCHVSTLANSQKGRCPQHNEQDARNEERCPTDETGGCLRETVEEFCLLLSHVVLLGSFGASLLSSALRGAAFEVPATSTIALDRELPVRNRRRCTTVGGG